MTFPRPVHSESATDAALAAEATKFVLAHPPVQILAGLVTILREKQPGWHTPETMLAFSPVAERMRAFETRPDIRQRLLVGLCNAKPKTARKTPIDMQGNQLLIAIEAEDVSIKDYELAHEALELALYLDSGALWRNIMQALPWERNEDSDKEIVAQLISSLIENGRQKTAWSPSGAILTPWDLMRGIEARVWNQNLPLDLRVKVHEAWVQATQDGAEKVFAPRDVFELVPPEVFMLHFSLLDLRKILQLAEERMGFNAPPVVEDVAPATRFEGSRSAPPSKADRDNSAIDDMFESTPPPPSEVAISVQATKPPPPGSPPPDAMMTLPPVGDAVHAMDLEIPAPAEIGVERIDSTVIDVVESDLDDGDLEELPPSQVSAQDPAPAQDAQAIEVARMMIDLDKRGIKIDGDPEKVRRVYAVVEKVLARTYNADESKISKVEALALKASLREVLVLFDPVAYGVERYTKGTVSLGGFIARIEHHLGMDVDKEGSGPHSVSSAPRPRSSGRSALPPPLPGSHTGTDPDDAKSPDPT